MRRSCGVLRASSPILPSGKAYALLLDLLLQEDPRSIQGLGNWTAQDLDQVTEMLSHWGNEDSEISHHISGLLISSPKNEEAGQVGP